MLLSELPDVVIPSFPRSIDAEKTVSTADLASIGAVAVQLSYGCPDAVAALTIEDQFNDILLVGSVFGAEAKAKEIVDGMKAQLADVQRRVGNLPNKPSVASFWVSNGRISPYGAGIPEQIVRLAGGTNVWGGQQAPGGQAIINISNESFASKPVDHFIITNLSGIATGAVGPDAAFDAVAKLHPDDARLGESQVRRGRGHAQQPSLVAIKAIVVRCQGASPDGVLAVKTIGILLFDGVQELDAIVPFRDPRRLDPYASGRRLAHDDGWSVGRRSGQGRGWSGDDTRSVPEGRRPYRPPRLPGRPRRT